MSEPGPHQERRQRRLFIALAVLFLAPLVLAFYLYYGPGWRPAGHVNHGELIDPPRPLPALALPLASSAHAERTTDPYFLKHKWTLLYWGSGACSARCRANLYDTRQVRVALNRDMGRVQRVFIAEGACCDMEYLRIEHPDLITVRATPAAAPLLARFPSVRGVNAASAERVYLIDPLGNLMMSYAPDSNPKGMLQDLKRLLGLSHIG